MEYGMMAFYLDRPTCAIFQRRFKGEFQFGQRREWISQGYVRWGSDRLS